MAPTGANKGEDKGIGDIANDLWLLLRDYAKQETIDPLKALGRFLKLGVPGAIIGSLGVFFLSLAVLRALQEETGTALTGVWDWVPYLAAFVVCLVVIGFSAVAIRRPFKEEGA